MPSSSFFIKKTSSCILFFAKIFLLFCLLIASFSEAQTNAFPPAGLQGLWTFDGTVNDQSSHHHRSTGHDITFTSDRFGNANGACYFNGVSSYIDTDYEGIMGSKPRAISLWLLIIGPLKKQTTICWGNNSQFPNNGRRFDVGINSENGAPAVGASDSGVTYENNGTVGDGKWHHFVFQFNKKTLRESEIYQDGVLLTKVKFSFYPNTLINTRPGYNLTIGMIPDYLDCHFRGYLDDIAIYNRMLSPDEIDDLYHAPDPKPKAAYRKWLLYFFILIAIVLLIFWIIRLWTKALVKKEKKKFQLERRWFEQESRVLRAQMDPHFIFNSLNTIEQFIHKDDNENAQLYLSTFSQLVRLQLESNMGESISLAQKIEVMEKYLEVESIRFDHAFDYEIQVDKALVTTHLYMPYFLIQPFVENAIHAHLLPKEGYKELDILFKKQDEKTLVCIVEDNGIEEKNNISEKQPGIHFVKQRLALMSKLEDHNYGIEVIPRKDEAGNNKGTRVIIRLPLVRQS